METIEFAKKFPVFPGLAHDEGATLRLGLKHD